MADPLVSIVIPTFRRPTTLNRTIDSVLNQTYSNLEVIVIDDNDPKSMYRQETQALMDQYCVNDKVAYLKHPSNLNGAAARNTGIRASRGKYIAFLDDDDEFYPYKLELQISRMENLEGSEVGGVYCNYERYTNGKFTLRTAHKYNRDEGDLSADLLMERNEIGAGSTSLIKKAIAEELGGFDENFLRHQDWEFMLRFFKKYNLALCEEILVRVHSEDNVNKKTAEQTLLIKQKYLEQFKAEIAGLDTLIQKHIYSRHWLVVAESFYQTGDRIKGEFYAKKALNYGGLSLKAKIKLHAYHLKVFGLVNGIIVSGRKLSSIKERIRLTARRGTR